MDNVELKEYLRDKIDSNHASTLLMLEEIRVQTTKTNGRVNILESKV